MIKNDFKAISTVTLSIFLASCNHLFYFPHKEIYVTPDHFNLEYRELAISGKDPDIILHGWHIRPLSPSRDIVVLQLHGNAENRSTHFFSVAWLTKHGVDIVALDYRGYNGSSGVPSRAGLVADVMAAIEWLAREFPRHRRFIIGQSLGGAVAIPALVRTDIRIDGFVIESAFHSYRGIGRMKLAEVWLTWPLQWLPWLLLSGDFDPIEDASKINTPVLAFHDRRDHVVPLRSGQLLYDAIPAEYRNVTISEGDRHVGAFTEDRGENRHRLLRFLGLTR